MWDEYHVSAEAIIDELLPDCHLVFMQEDVSVTQNVNPVGFLEKRLHAAGQCFKYEDKIPTMFRGLPNPYTNTGDLVREFGKHHHESVAILPAEEAEIKRSGDILTQNQRNKKASNIRHSQLKDACYQFCKEEHYKRYFLELYGGKKHYLTLHC